MDAEEIRPPPQPLAKGMARRCLDGSERRDHLGGRLGVGLMRRMVALGWLERGEAARTMVITPAGTAALSERLGLECSRWHVRPCPQQPILPRQQ